MLDIDTVITATLTEWRRSAHVYGLSDCLLSCADYGRDLTGVDIGAPWRGTYSTEAEALAIVAAYGGTVVLLGGALRPAGFVSVETPERGDVVVVRIGQGEFGGICLGKFLALRNPRGVRELRFGPDALLGAWRCRI